jgi:methylated-DNA-[protein]-cysteine S-methyltransferase
VTRATWHTLPSPIGELLVGATERGVCLISWSDHDVALDRLERRYGEPRPGGIAAAAAGELAEYFAGRRRVFGVPLDLSGETIFRRRVLELLAEIPFGELISYGELARELRSGPRAVGQAVGSNPVPVVVPCHRVVAADGTLGGYGGGLERKRVLLALEGRDGLAGGWAPRRARPRSAPPVLV